MSLKNLRSQVAQLNQNQAEGKTGKKVYEADPRSYFPKLNADGSGSAVIRFLPGTETMFNAGFTNGRVILFGHNFKSANGTWVIENCPTSIGEDCPICTDNRDMWAVNEAGVRARRSLRNTRNFVNIQVISDPATPENNGKNFYLKASKEIMTIVDGAATPQFADETPKFAFDIDGGYDFHFKIFKDANKKDNDGKAQTSYAKCKFADNPRPIANTDEGIEKILAGCIELTEFVASTEFKSYDAIKKHFDRAVGNRASVSEVPPAAARAAYSAPKPASAEQLEDADIEALQRMAEEG